ncbi:helix-turn-helix domain-containing protein [Saccharopolyspora shandongensis]|uniref:helix-turn-helix domain-containing protein n=1 Tax=Saccharopolyspora shandongensis TaxID=418495 RepID=UPI0033F8D748
MTAAITTDPLAQADTTMTVREAAKILGISHQTAYNLINAGTFPVRVLKLGRVHRVVTASLRAYINGQDEK